MKKIPLFEQCVANVAPEVMEEVNLNIDIANRIYDLLKAKNLTQHEFASRMGKRDSEISRWLTGTHGFTTATLAKISAVLGEPIVEVRRDPETKYVFMSMPSYNSSLGISGNSYTSHETNSCVISYEN
ncbi:helix-turn-helix domain-containing protein [Barnesiella intestinihominis]|uniref:HTH cro/C1-type domain-containing protein n=2 Tax=Barnesiella intestinihominis TaxID=487174 RepID=K0XLL2_9BACT|nr:helix-turn-helix transcriptional regulator [Barnesiella intestinihominis]EJZ64720.1 hypothetical protein HMPREF9448_01202 [Barnesiella intestinihominis YIT 11860]MDB0665880.1 helix-turn-helix transcriptional regulator [Barnesiella intestinihominis]MDB0668529.1 helix-turn-helix transcriptional regulator [Barnesiella intestinihominis]